jgi:hypothetical protein
LGALGIVDRHFDGKGVHAGLAGNFDHARIGGPRGTDGSEKPENDEDDSAKAVHGPHLGAQAPDWQ